MPEGGRFDRSIQRSLRDVADSELLSSANEGIKSFAGLSYAPSMPFRSERVWANSGLIVAGPAGRTGVTPGGDDV